METCLPLQVARIFEPVVSVAGMYRVLIIGFDMFKVRCSGGKQGLEIGDQINYSLNSVPVFLENRYGLCILVLTLALHLCYNPVPSVKCGV